MTRISPINRVGDTPVMQAVTHGTTELARDLIQAAATDEINLTNCYGNNALMRAAAHGKVDLVVLLAQKMPTDKIWARNALGQTVFDIAREYRHPEVTELLNELLARRK